MRSIVGRVAFPDGPALERAPVSPLVSATLDLFATGDGSAEADRASARSGSRIETLATVVEGVEGLAQLEPVWRGVARAADDRCAFQSFGFALAAARYHHERGERVLTAVAEWGERPACLLPIAVRRRAGVSVGVFLGDPVIQYGDALTVSGAPARTSELALKRLTTSSGVDAFDFRRVRDDAAIAGALRALASRAGEAVEAPFADMALERSADAFLLRIAGQKQKRERARSRRRLAERGQTRFDVFRGAEAVEPLRRAFALKRRWLAAQGDASPVVDDPRALAMLERLAFDAQDGASLVVARLSVAGEPAAYEVGVVRGRRFHAYLGAVAEGFAAASPGKVVMEDMLGWCLAEGVDLYDLLPPADAYKSRWSNGAVEVRNHVVPVTLKGRLYADLWLSRLRPRLRLALASTPAGLRRRLGAAALKIGAA